MAGRFGATWGLAGVFLLLGSAACRLAPLALEPLAMPLRWYHWLAMAGSILFMAHAEGYRGFQQHFSPRVAARARYLRNHPRPLFVAFAPFFCMGYFHATRRRQVVSLSLTAGIAVLVVAVRQVPQPWRGIIDAGVVAGLAWGLISLAWFTLRAFTAESFPYSPEVPGHSAPEPARTSSPPDRSCPPA